MKDNKLIAEFMGLPEQGNTYEDPYSGEYVEAIELSYDESWDWLMPVVDKIEGLGYWVNRNDGDVTITDESDIIVITPMSSGGIDMMYKAVVEFIKDYKS